MSPHLNSALLRVTIVLLAIGLLRKADIDAAARVTLSVLIGLSAVGLVADFAQWRVERSA